MAPRSNKVDMALLFQEVTQALAENQQNLNQADSYNHDHGSNMLHTFETITGALQEKKKSSGSAALRYAAKQLAANQTSSSSKLYAQNLNQAARQIKGKKVAPEDAMQLLQTLIGGGQAAQAQGSGGDAMTDLLGGLMGEGGAQGQAGGDMLGTLLGSLSGGSSQRQQQGGLNIGNLISAGMAYMQAKQGGGSNMEALTQAFMAGSGMGTSPHRTESTQIVVDTFMKALSKYTNR